MNIEELKKDINILRKEKKAIILSHYYQTSDIQDIANFLGDSLALSQQAYSTQAELIVFAGVYFMAETAKILNPEKKVIIPDLEAGCSLADSCQPEKFILFRDQYPDHIVVSYINCSAEIKALSDIICTSSNAVKIINSIPREQKILFAPDRNLGAYVRQITGRNMVLWDGACDVHDEIKTEMVMALKQQYPDAKLIAHPECKAIVLALADFVGSTSQLLHFITHDTTKRYIVATESGILHAMQQALPDKEFIVVPVDKNCSCNDCQFMKKITLEKIWHALNVEQHEILIDESIQKKALKPILRMLEISK